jgi:tetratricopeptide (TPR) repeat protein
MPGVSFEELERRADAAWDGARLPEALRFYRAGVELNPRWVNGLWRLGLLFWMTDCPAEGRDALRRLLAVTPDSSQGWALLGLTEYQLHEYDQSLLHLSRGTEIGLPEGAIALEARHALALLLVRSGDFAAGARALSALSRVKPDDPELLMASGLVALRMPRLPSEVEATDEDLVRSAGRAAHAALAGEMEEALEAFDALTARYPTTRGVHLAYGLVLSHAAFPGALEMLQKEVELFPDSADAQAALALEILTRGDPAAALAPARAAVELRPGWFSSQLALGRALVATGATREAIVALEEAARLDPESVETHVALAQAYQSAGRTEDVERTRQKLTELYARRERAE